MDTINLNLARTGCVSTSPMCLHLRPGFELDPASYDVIDAPGWIPTGSHCHSLMDATVFGERAIVSAEMLRRW